MASGSASEPGSSGAAQESGFRLARSLLRPRRRGERTRPAARGPRSRPGAARRPAPAFPRTVTALRQAFLQAPSPIRNAPSPLPETISLPPAGRARGGGVPTLFLSPQGGGSGSSFLPILPPPLRGGVGEGVSVTINPRRTPLSR